MKPEHFIYKSDGLYYMQNVPDRPVLSCGVEATESNCPLEYCRCYKKTIAYNEALERAKEEAVKVDDDSSRLEIGFRISKAYDLGKNQSELGKIYTINMEENIVVVSKNCNSMGCSCGGKIARIAAPKKEEESEAQLLHEIIDNYREYQQDIKHGSQKSLYDFMAEELDKFEIKRKPL